jgi:predicted DNA-binding transcriptional regulator AlpA
VSLTVPERENILPTSLPPRGLSRVQSAAYVGVSVTLFDEMVKDGRMPQPVRINSRVLWDRLQLDEAFAALSDTRSGGDDPWNKVSL